MKPNSPRSVRAFTLIELLVVISIIAVLAGGVGLALKGGNPGAALRGGQSTLLSTIAAAKGQAALTQVNSMIIVDADSNSDTFLRSVRVVVEKSSNVWTEVGTPVIMPQNIYIVPNGALSGTTLSSASPSRFSNFFTVAGSVPGITGTFLQSNKFTPLGALGGGVGGRLLVAAGTVTGPNAVSIDNTNTVRGLVLSRYGIPALVSEGESLGN